MWGEFAQSGDVSCRCGSADLGFAGRGSELACLWGCRSPCPAALHPGVGMKEPTAVSHQKKEKCRVRGSTIKRASKLRSKAASVFMGGISSPSGDVSPGRSWWRYPRAVSYPSSVGKGAFSAPHPYLPQACSSWPQTELVTPTTPRDHSLRLLCAEVPAG